MEVWLLVVVLVMLAVLLLVLVLVLMLLLLLVFVFIVVAAPVPLVLLIPLRLAKLEPPSPIRSPPVCRVSEVVFHVATTFCALPLPSRLLLEACVFLNLKKACVA